MNNKEILSKIYEFIETYYIAKNESPKGLDDFLADIKQDLNQLYVLEKENEILKKAIENSNKSYDILMQNSNIQFLNQNQEIFKLKKVIEILKDCLGIELWKTSDGKYYLREGYHDILLTQEEYDLLKEHLGNDEK